MFNCSNLQCKQSYRTWRSEKKGDQSTYCCCCWSHSCVSVRLFLPRSPGCFVSVFFCLMSVLLPWLLYSRLSLPWLVSAWLPGCLHLLLLLHFTPQSSWMRAAPRPPHASDMETSSLPALLSWLDRCCYHHQSGGSKRTHLCIWRRLTRTSRPPAVRLDGPVLIE